MKKILIVGNIDSIWIKKYIENVLDDSEFQVFVSGMFDNDKKLVADYYEKNKVIVIQPELSRMIKHIPVIKHFIFTLKVKREMKKYGDFDYVQLHFVRKRQLFETYLLRKQYKKLILSYWGSDLLRTSLKELKSFRKYIDRADYITLTSDVMLSNFKEVYGARYDKKIVRTKFGISSLDSIDKLNGDILMSRKSFEIPEDAMVITVGYNRAEKQQHLKVLEALGKIPKDVLDKCYLIFPMAYGTCKNNYCEIVAQKAADIGVRYKVIEDFLNDDGIAALRLASDLFIHAQPTDALSASLQEYLYAGKLVFNPVWISYPELQNKGVYYVEYGDFEELKVKLIETLTYGISNELKKKLNNNKEIISNMSSWKNVKKAWQTLYTD